MIRKLTEPKIVLASHNAGKLREIQALLQPFGKTRVSAAIWAWKSQKKPKIALPETRGSFISPPKRQACPLSDDSGISVDALDGAPGVYTADWAEPGTVGILPWRWPVFGIFLKTKSAFAAQSSVQLYPVPGLAGWP